MHKHTPYKTRDTGWTRCVTPHECAADPGRGDAHGGIVRIETCKCGAVRRTEINGTSRNTTGWIKPDESGM